MNINNPEAHPGKMHIYNLRGYCWCGAHRDDWLRDEEMLERIGEALAEKREKAERAGRQMEHSNEGTREIDAANYQGRVWQCSCGERFEDKSELEQHIKESE